MTNPEGNAGETPPYASSTGSSDASSGAYEPPPIEQSQTPPWEPPLDYPADAGLPPPVFPPPGPGPAGYPDYNYPTSYPTSYPTDYPTGYPTYPYQVDPYDPYRTAPYKPPGTNGKAVASLVTSLTGLLCCALPSIVGLILGIVAMRETRRTGQDGYGIALAGTVIGGLMSAFLVLYLLIAFILFLIDIPYS